MGSGPQPYEIRWDGPSESIQYIQNGVWYSIPNAGAPGGIPTPSFTTTQKNAIASPALGLMVFDSTLSKLSVWTGSAWQTVTSA